jgi:hypothetical protein
VGILAYRSALAGSNSLAVPDFRREADRRKFANDEWSPDPARRRKGDPWPSVEGDVKPSRQGLAAARKVWKQMGYEGQ